MSLDAYPFLAAILERPDDDGPRLVYADWLEEQGDPDRAELIRIQCAMAALPEWHPRRWRLAWREYELLHDHGAAWRAELPAIDGVEWGNFVRGFVNEIVVEQPTTLAEREAEIWSAAPIEWAAVVPDPDQEDALEWYCRPCRSLRGLRIQDMNGAADDPEAVFTTPLLAGIRKLDLSLLSVGEQLFVHLSRSPHLGGMTELNFNFGFAGAGSLWFLTESIGPRQLQVLHAQNCGNSSDGTPFQADDAEMFAECPRLRHLTTFGLANNEVGNFGLRHLLTSPHLANLRELDLTANGITAAGMGAFVNVPSGMRLGSLTLSSNEVAAFGAQALAGSPALAEVRHLALSKCEIDAEAAAELAAAPWVNGLVSLDLSHNAIGPAGARALAAGIRSSDLLALSLCDNELDDASVGQLVQAPCAKNLIALDLSENALGPAGVRALAEALRSSPLLDLNLERCGLEREAAHTLALADFLPRLTRLTLSNNPIGSEGMALLTGLGRPLALRELALSGCEIRTVGMEMLAGIDLPHLAVLDLSRNPLGAAGVEALARSPLAARVTDLDLTGAGIDDAAVDVLVAGTWPRLRRLVLSHNPLTERAARKLAAAAELRGVTAIHLRETRVPWDSFPAFGPRFLPW